MTTTQTAVTLLPFHAMLCMQGQGVVKGYAIGKAADMSAAAKEDDHYRITVE
jgi:phosphotransferase system enzyme I (PtsI)